MALKVLDIQTLIAEGKIVDITQIDTNNAYISLGYWQPGSRKAGDGSNSYPQYVLTVADLLSGATGISSVTADNGLNISNVDPSNPNIQLGGPLLANTDIDATGFEFNINNGAVSMLNVDASTNVIGLRSKNFLFNGTSTILTVSNNLGNYLQITDCGGFLINDFNTNAGAFGNADFKAFIRNFQVWSSRSGANPTGSPYINVVNNNSWNSAPYFTMGINIDQTTLPSYQYAVVTVNLDKQGASNNFGSVYNTKIIDSYVYNENSVNDGYKYGIHINMDKSFTNAGAGTFYTTALYAKASSADVNYAARFDGRINVANLPTSSAGLLTGDLWIDTAAGNVIKVA